MLKRRAAFAFGLVALAGAWLVPWERLLGGGFSGHMAMHMGVVAVAAPLLAWSLAGGPFDPLRRARAVFSPLAASVVELLVVWGWHAPALHHAARHSTAGLVLEQGSFLFSGLLVWLTALGGAASGRADRGAAGVLALLLTSMHMTLLGALLALPPRALYQHHANGALSPIHDQHLGGAIMLGVGGVAYLVGGLGLSLELLRVRATAQRGAR